MTKSAIGMAAAWVGLLLAPAAEAANTRVTNPNALVIEALGRGVLWSVNFNRVISEELAFSVGYGSVGVSGGAATASLVPFSAEYFFMKDQGSLYATGGVTLVANASSVANQASSPGGLGFSSSPVLPHFGVGYENRSDAGFLFRVTAYGIIGSTISPWGGISFGYSF